MPRSTPTLHYQRVMLVSILTPSGGPRRGTTTPFLINNAPYRSGLRLVCLTRSCLPYNHAPRFPSDLLRPQWGCKSHGDLVPWKMHTQHPCPCPHSGNRPHKPDPFLRGSIPTQNRHDAFSEFMATSIVPERIHLYFPEDPQNIPYDGSLHES